MTHKNFAKHFYGGEKPDKTTISTVLRGVSPLPHISFLITTLPPCRSFSLHHHHHRRPFHIRRPRRIEFLHRTSIERLYTYASPRTYNRYVLALERDLSEEGKKKGTKVTQSRMRQQFTRVRNAPYKPL